MVCRKNLPNNMDYYSEIGGQRNGRADPNFPRYKVPCCKVPCNDVLSERFEDTKQPGNTLPIKKLFDGEKQFSEIEIKFIGEWLLKTLLLLHHQEAVENDSKKPYFQGMPIEKEHVSWAVDGDSPSKSFSMWIAHIDNSLPHQSRKSENRFLLRNLTSETTGKTYESFSFSLSLANLMITVMYHPGWIPDLENLEFGTQILPSPESLEIESVESTRDIQGYFFQHDEVLFADEESLQNVLMNPPTLKPGSLTTINGVCSLSQIYFSLGATRIQPNDNKKLSHSSEAIFSSLTGS